MMRRAVIKPHAQIIEAFGLTLVDVVPTGGGHYKYIVTSGAHRHFFICPASPSDRMSLQAFKKDVRQWARSVEMRQAA